LNEYRHILKDLKPENTQLKLTPMTILTKELNNQFYSNVPTNTEGQALSNIEAGIKIDHINRDVKIKEKPEGL
jgi:hypothetical protein